MQATNGCRACVEFAEHVTMGKRKVEFHAMVLPNKHHVARFSGKCLGKETTQFEKLTL